MNADILRALQAARYNEIVQVHVSDGENSREIVLSATLDEENGGIQWNDYSSSVDPNFGLQKHLQTKRWMFPMLNDHRRNELYDEAIRRACQKVVKRFSANHDEAEVMKGLDIGSGTALLAMMSVKYLTESLAESSKKVEVTSLEMSSAMAEVARRTVASNLMHDRLEVIEGHSCEFPPMEPRAQICTSELLESGLLGEGWLPALRDAWERHLDPQAVVVPCRARVFAQVAEGECLSNYWGPHQWLENFPNNKALRLCTSHSDNDVLLGSNETMDGVQVPVHINKFQTDDMAKLRLLSEPISILEIDVSSKESIPSPNGQSKTKEFIPIASGIAQGVIFWWELDFFDDLTYSTGHGQGPWQDHWHQCIFVFPKRKPECTQLVKGLPAILKAAHNDSRIFFSVNPVATDAERSAKRPRHVSETKFQISPERAWHLNDLQRISILRDGIHYALRKQGQESVVLDLSDFSLCAMIASLLGAKSVTSLETSSGDLPVSTAHIAQIANGLPTNPDNPHSFQIVRCHAEQLTSDLLGGPASLIIAEPYYEILEGWHLQEALNYYYISRGLKRRGVLNNEFLSVPSYASIKVFAFEAKDVSSAYKRCDVNLRGFKHSSVNELCCFANHDITLPTWQYDVEPMTESIEVARIDYDNCEIVKNPTPIKIPFKKEGTCHGMLVYVDYGVSVDDGEAVISTKERPYNQAIRMLPSPVTIELKNSNTPHAFFCCSVKLGKAEVPQEDHSFEISIQKA